MSENINKALEPLRVPLAGLKLDPENARKHDDRSVEGIKSSLREFGQQKPIVVLNDGTIIAGNGTYRAAKALGWQRIAAVRFADLKKARAYALMDNRSAELSEWDNPVLAKQLEELSAQLVDFNPEMVGFTEAEMMKLISSVQTEEVEDNSPPPTVDGPVPTDGSFGPPSHVRMVQLFLDETTQPRFMEAVRVLSTSYKTNNVTDTVLRCVEEAVSAGQSPTP
jgi:hypothetical protein